MKKRDQFIRKTYQSSMRMYPMSKLQNTQIKDKTEKRKRSTNRDADVNTLSNWTSRQKVSKNTDDLKNIHIKITTLNQFDLIYIEHIVSKAHETVTKRDHILGHNILTFKRTEIIQHIFSGGSKN